MLKPGDTVYTVLRHVARSGMQRRISCIVIDKETGSPFQIDWLVSWATGERLDREKEGLVVGGCGMDMGFHLVYNLSRSLFPDGYKPKDAGKQYGRNGRPADETDKDGGYALQQRWL